jgi:hypothetical protein
MPPKTSGSSVGWRAGRTKQARTRDAKLRSIFRSRGLQVPRGFLSGSVRIVLPHSGRVADIRSYGPACHVRESRGITDPSCRCVLRVSADDEGGHAIKEVNEFHPPSCATERSLRKLRRCNALSGWDEGGKSDRRRGEGGISPYEDGSRDNSARSSKGEGEDGGCEPRRGHGPGEPCERGKEMAGKTTSRPLSPASSYPNPPFCRKGALLNDDAAPDPDPAPGYAGR